MVPLVTPPDSDAICGECGAKKGPWYPYCTKAGEFGVHVSKPDSGGRELCEVCGRLSVTSLGSCVPGTSIDTVCFRVKCGADTTCYQVGYERLAALVCIEPSLAQRILAALELQPLSLGSLAAELRAVMPR